MFDLLNKTATERQRISYAVNEIFSRNPPRTTPLLQMVRTVGNNVLDRIKSLDTRFNVDSIDVGSLACGTSAVVINECDAVIPVSIHGTLENSTNKEYVRLKPTGESADNWKDCLNNHGYMDPTKFSKTFYNLVDQALSATKKEVKYNLSLRGEETVAATIVYYFDFAYESSVDLVPIVVAHLNGGKSTLFFRDPTYHHLKDIGVELSAKLNESDVLGWRLSFSCYETDLIKRISSSHEIFKKLLVVYKIIRRYYLSPKEARFSPDRNNSTSILRSYHFKILLLLEYDEYPDPCYWTENCTAVRFLSILQRLIGYVSKRFFPHYKLPEINLFCRHDAPLVPKFLLHHELVTNTVSFLEKATNVQFD